MKPSRAHLLVHVDVHAKLKLVTSPGARYVESKNLLIRARSGEAEPCTSVGAF